MKDIKVPSSVEGVDLFRLPQNRRLTVVKGTRIASTVVDVEVRGREAILHERNTAEIVGRERCERAWREAFGFLPWDLATWTISHVTARCVVSLSVEQE